MFEDVEANTVSVCCHCDSQGILWSASRRTMTGAIAIAVESTRSSSTFVEFLKPAVVFFID